MFGYIMHTIVSTTLPDFLTDFDYLRTARTYSVHLPSHEPAITESEAGRQGTNLVH